MQAFVVREYGGPGGAGLEDVATPEPGPGEVLIRVRAITVNRTRDLDVIGGRPGDPDALPLVPGVDPAGEVAATGGGVTGLRPGDRVVVWSRTACGACADCTEGNEGNCAHGRTMGVHCWGGYAEYMVAPAANVFAIRGALSFAEAAVVMRHYPTAFQLLEDKAALRPGEWVLVMGAGGGLGSCGVQAAKSMGARVIAGAGAEERVAVGLDGGADHGVNYRARDLTAAVMDITGGAGVNVVFENISDPTTWSKAFASLAHGGRLVTAGAHGGGQVTLDIKRLYYRRIKVMGAAGASRGNVARALEGAAAGTLTAVVEHVLPLAELPTAWDTLATGGVRGKIVIDPSRDDGR